MTEKKTQKTRKEKFEIPIPKRSDVMNVFKKAATHQEKREKKSGTRSPKPRSRYWRRGTRRLHSMDA